MLVSMIALIFDPEQLACDDGVAVATGIGLMITLNEQLAVFPAPSVAW